MCYKNGPYIYVWSKSKKLKKNMSNSQIIYVSKKTLFFFRPGISHNKKSLPNEKSKWKS